MTLKYGLFYESVNNLNYIYEEVEKSQDKNIKDCTEVFWNPHRTGLFNRCNSDISHRQYATLDAIKSIVKLAFAILITPFYLLLIAAEGLLDRKAHHVSIWLSPGNKCITVASIANELFADIVAMIAGERIVFGHQGLVNNLNPPQFITARSLRKQDIFGFSRNYVIERTHPSYNLHINENTRSQNLKAEIKNLAIDILKIFGAVLDAAIAVPAIALTIVIECPRSYFSRGKMPSYIGEIASRCIDGAVCGLGDLSNALTSPLRMVNAILTDPHTRQFGC